VDGAVNAALACLGSVRRLRQGNPLHKGGGKPPLHPISGRTSNKVLGLVHVRLNDAFRSSNSYQTNWLRDHLGVGGVSRILSLAGNGARGLQFLEFDRGRGLEGLVVDFLGV
jgi:hypothetical protein